MGIWHVIFLWCLLYPDQYYGADAQSAQQVCLGQVVYMCLMLLVLLIVCESYRFATYQMDLPLCPQSRTWSRLFNCSLADNFLILSLGAASVW